MVLAVNYSYIATAISFYKSRKYTPLNVPWFVSRKALEVTAPPNRRYCSSFIGDLVASGEQSFIQMWMDDNLKPGKWQCATPCFRDELVVDELHHNYFMKVELIEVSPSNYYKSILKMIDNAVLFLDPHFDDPVNIVETEFGFDIVSPDGIELGSYGYREHGEFKWVYGTGVAEPRLSYAIQNQISR